MSDNFRTSGQFRIFQNLLKIGVDLIGRGVETEEDVEARECSEKPGEALNLGEEVKEEEKEEEV